MPRLKQQILLLTGMLASGTLSNGLPGWNAAAQAAQNPSAAGAVLEAKLGDFLSVPLQLGSAVNTTYTVETHLPEGWTLLSNEVKVQAGRGVVMLFLPDDARAGVQPLELSLRAADGTQVRLPVQIKVPAQPAFTLSFPTEARIRPGEQRVFAARILNTGNTPDVLRLKVQGSAQLVRDYLELQPGQSATVAVAYNQRSLGNADSVTLSATSSVDPQVSHEKILTLTVGQSLSRASGPQMAWSVALSPQVTYQTQPVATSTATPTTTAPTLPGLPNGQAATDPLSAAASPLTWSGDATASLGGALSDYASLAGSFGVRRTELGQVRDSGLLRLDWGRTTLKFNTQERFSQVGLDAERTQGRYTYSAGINRVVTVTGEAAYGVRARIENNDGLFVQASKLLGAADNFAVGAGWRRRLGLWTPGAEVYGTWSGGQWGYLVQQSLDYENRLLLAHQAYQYDSLRDAQQFGFKVSSRQVRPYGVGGEFIWNRVAGVSRYALSGVVTYDPNDDLSAKVIASLENSGFGVQASALKVWHLGVNELYLDAKSEYREGRLSGTAQLTGVFPRGPGRYLLSGLAGYNQGLIYGAGVGYAKDQFSVAAGVQVRPDTLDATASLRYLPVRGVQGTADYLLHREQDANTHSLRLTAGYGTERWNAALIGGYQLRPGEAGQYLYGAQVGAVIFQNMRLTAQVERLGEQTRFRAGMNFVPGGAFNTPSPIVKLFGGRNAGTLKIHAFVDANRNGQQDAGEIPFKSSFQVGGFDLKTDAQGNGNLLLRPDKYNINLGDEVLAQYLLPDLPLTEIKLKQTTALNLPVQQVGRVQGQVQDDAGRPLAGVPVQISGPEDTKTALTDAAGQYQVSGLRFGEYLLSVQANPALYQLDDAQKVSLNGDHPLQTYDLTLKTIQLVSGLSDNSIPIEVVAPDYEVPPGAKVLLSLSAPATTEKFTVNGNEVPFKLVAGSSDQWQGYFTVPAEQKLPLEVQISVKQGDKGGSGSAILLVDPALKPEMLRLNPFNALAEQVVMLRASVFGNALAVEVRDDAGQVVSLKRVADNQYEGQLKAGTAAGEHKLTLLVDGQAKADATYRVLGRP